MRCQKTNALTVGIKPIRLTALNALSLVEMLIALTLGAFLLLVFSHFYAEFHRLQSQQKEQLFLQKEAHQFANFIQQHIQHLGYQGGNREGSNFALFEQQGKRYALPHPSCLVFFYDVNNDGCLGKKASKRTACISGEVNNTKELAKETFGVKLENREIYLYSDNKLENCVGEQCQALLNSCGRRWRKFTSMNDFNVDKFHFSWKKAGELLRFELTLSSVKEKNVSYQLSADIYLLNQNEKTPEN